MVKIDAMFFSATEETCALTGSQRKKGGDIENGAKGARDPKYLDYDTFILCNPNAMSYQHMINYPHAYYLKFFLNK